MTFSDSEKAKAEDLFDTHMRSKGAFMRGWFKRIHRKDQEIWLRAAKKILSETI